MSNTIPLPEPAYTLPFPDDDELAFSARQMREYAAAVTAAKDKEIAQLRAELIKSLADNAALRAEVAGLREFVEHVRRNGGTHLANMAIAVLAARKGEA